MTAHELRRDIEEIDKFLSCIDKAAHESLEHLYHKELNLTDSIPETAIARWLIASRRPGILGRCPQYKALLFCRIRSWLLPPCTTKKQ